MTDNVDILTQLEHSEITFTTPGEGYAASRIARAVEDCDAHLLGLTTAPLPASYGAMSVTIAVNRRDPSPIVRSLERYGYNVVDTRAPESLDEATARSRARELLHYLEI